MPAIQLNTVEERESFDFFTSYAVTSLRGCLDLSFWKREVLQAAQQIPAIQHCVIALGAMYRRFYESDGPQAGQAALLDRQLQFALRQCNAAIRTLVKGNDCSTEMVKADRVTLMTCSILFSSMACLQGHQRDAYDHLRSGIQMLNEMDAQEEPTAAYCHPIEVDSLRALFVALDLQARSMRPSRESKEWVAAPKAKLTDDLPGSELNMSALIVLLSYQESLLNNIFAFHHSVVYRPAEEAHLVLPRYYDLLLRSHRSALALARFNKKSKTSAGDFSEALTALELQQSQIEYILRSPRPDIDTKFKMTASLTAENSPYAEPFDPTAHFSQMYSLSSRLLFASNTTQPPKPVFTIGAGPIPALCLIAMRAPSSCHELRKRAVGLMLSQPRREGLWDARISGKIAQTLMDFEQQNTREALGLGDSVIGDVEVPPELRVIAVLLGEAEGEKSGTKMEFLTKGDVEAGRKGFRTP